jgi:hypothetical protein
MNSAVRAARRVVGAALLGCVTTCSTAIAADRGLLDDAFVLQLGTFLLATDTKVALDGSAGQAGTVVDLERDTGMDDSNRFRVDGLWRIGGGRHHVRAMYFEVDRTGSRQTDRELAVGDVTYPVSAAVTAKLQSKILEVAYEYAFVDRETLEVAASVGAHALKLDFQIRGDGLVNGRPVSGAAETGDTNAPLPVVGVRGMWRVADDWYLDAQGQWFSVKLDQIDGSLSDLRAGVTWMFTDHVGAGVGWNRFVVDVDAAKKNFDGSLRWRYQGAHLYLTGSF